MMVGKRVLVALYEDEFKGTVAAFNGAEVIVRVSESDPICTLSV